MGGQVKRGRIWRGIWVLVLAVLFLVMFLAKAEPDKPVFLAGAKLTTLEHHRHLTTALAAGKLSQLPNADNTPRFPHGPHSNDVGEGEGLVLIVDEVHIDENKTDSGTARSLRLVIPAELYSDRMELDFRNGLSDGGALLFVSNTSHAWNWTTIGYPVSGTVRLNRTGRDNIDAEFEVNYRCARFIYRNSSDGTVHKGWEAIPAAECPQDLFPAELSFRKVIFVHLSDKAEKLPYNGGG